jgi:hypothetical protein
MENYKGHLIDVSAEGTRFKYTVHRMAGSALAAAALGTESTRGRAIERAKALARAFQARLASAKPAKQRAEAG